MLGAVNQRQPIVSSSTTLAESTTFVATTTTDPTATTRITGVLPDGTTYSLSTDDVFEDVSIDGISAAVVIDLMDGTSPVIGITTFRRGGSQSPTPYFEGGLLVLEAGEWFVRVDLYDHVLQELGPDVEQILVSSISGYSVSGLPVLDLNLPFRFARDDEVPLQMMVQYPDFVVMRGCDERLGAICNATRAVQVVPSSALFAPTEEVPLPEPLYLESSAPRPASDLYFMDKGPLDVRGSHSLFWTGQELLVWGGSKGDERDFLVDGALFNPVTSTWRMLPPSPMSPQPTVAAWTGSELIVVGTTNAAAWDESGWRGLTVPDDLPIGSRAAVSGWDGERMLIWSGDKMAAYDPVTNTWSSLPAPSGSTLRALHANDGLVVALGFNQAECFPLEGYVLSGSDWEALPEVDVGTPSRHGCVIPSTTALIGDRLIVWDTAANETRTMAFDFASERWSEVGPNPLDGSESFPQPLTTDSFVLAFDNDSNAALYEPNKDLWRLVRTPGLGGPWTAWTGQEVLTWGAPCCRAGTDAWRWQLSDELAP
jgi:hypothetical protein